MCGIFGLIAGKDADRGSAGVRDLLTRLFLLSESRGREAAGLALLPPPRRAPAPAQGSEPLRIHKEARSARRMLRSRAYRDFLRETLPSGGEVRGLLAAGHSRLVTNGSQLRPENNQPCAASGLAMVHNGIIVNDTELWRRYPELVREGEVDTEVLLKLIARFLAEGMGRFAAVATAFSHIQGSASIALLDGAAGELILATNTGSLYTRLAGGIMAFASEAGILEKALGVSGSTQVPPGFGLGFSADELAGRRFALGPPPPPRRSAPAAGPDGLLRIARPAAPQADWEPPPDPGLRRCARCILPETMPFVDFDERGVCRYCRTYVRRIPEGPQALEQALSRHRSGNGRPDCILAFSGGRDSSYGLHLLKRELGMHPVAFSYDWGIVTDLARRNQARLSGQLGVEHILVSADIGRKRGNIRRNVDAWLRRPRLGMIPLFMAGDKQFFWHANRLKRETGIRLVVYCENPLEITHFKTGFLGSKERGGRAYDMPLLGRFGLGLAYAREFLANPAYLNRSLWDSALAYASAYFIEHEYLYLFRYLPWEEESLNRTLLDGYGWETSPDTPSTWRIGDGSAAFYNYIYLTVAGFTEFDAFRSNQIREGLLDRDEALRRVREENRPRWASMREYADIVGFDLPRAVRVIRAMPRIHRPAHAP